jgi:hypothetical protein
MARTIHHQLTKCDVKYVSAMTLGLHIFYGSSSIYSSCPFGNLGRKYVRYAVEMLRNRYSVINEASAHTTGQYTFRQINQYNSPKLQIVQGGSTR